MKTITFFLLVSSFVVAQQNCPRCISPQTQQQMNQGAAILGAALGERAARHRFEDFCRKNLGQIYHDQKCPANFADYMFGVWILDHPKFHQSEVNIALMDSWISNNHQDPTRYKTYDKAFKALRKEGKVELNLLR